MKFHFAPTSCNLTVFNGLLGYRHRHKYYPSCILILSREGRPNRFSLFCKFVRIVISVIRVLTIFSSKYDTIIGYWDGVITLGSLHVSASHKYPQLDLKYKIDYTSITPLKSHLTWMRFQLLVYVLIWFLPYLYLSKNNYNKSFGCNSNYQS